MRKLPNAVIESKAINALEDIIDDTLLLHHDFQQIDKAPAWDGNILLYNHVEGDFKNEYLDAKLPVQIKGHYDEKEQYLGKKQISWKVKLHDLNIYSKDGGVLYFHIFVKGKERQIFYAPMHPIMIKYYLDLAEKKGNRTQIDVTFFRLNPSPIDILKIVRAFYLNRNKMGSGIGQLVSRAIKYEDIGKQTEFKFIVMEPQTINEILNGFKTGDICIYSPLGDTGLYLPHEWPGPADKTILFYKSKKNVRIGDMVFYESVQMRLTSDNESVYIFSENLELEQGKQQVKIDLHPKSDIHTLANDVRFLMQLQSKGEFSVDDNIVKIPGALVGNDNKDIFEMYIRTAEAFDRIGLKCQKPCREYTEKNIREINNLLALLDGTRNDELETTVTLFTWSFDGGYVSFFIIKNEDGSIKTEGLFEKDKYGIFIEDSSGKLRLIPSFRVVDPQHLARQLNQCTLQIKDQIDSEEIIPEMAEQFMICGLVLINAYDVGKDNCFLELASYQFDRIKSIADYEVLLINECQVKKRYGRLDDDMIEKLIIIKDNSKYTQFCVNTLLEHKSDAEAAFKRFTHEEQEEYEQWPIYTLFRSL